MNDEERGGSGIFWKYQPRYAEQNVITFPVRANKKPAVKHWQKLGLEGSAKLAVKFSDADTFGFPLGPRSGVTILDVDSTDESVLHKAQSRYGETPFVVQTGGGYHAYYRYGGERRHIRPWGPDLPIDVLGGGYAVGAPSVASKGQYQIVRGTLDDLKNLPPLHAVLDELRKPIPEGRRNQSLFRMGLEQAPHVDDFETLMDVMRTRNMDCTAPLPESELESVARSAWKYEREGRNLVGSGGSTSPNADDKELTRRAQMDHPRRRASAQEGLGTAATGRTDLTTAPSLITCLQGRRDRPGDLRTNPDARPTLPMNIRTGPLCGLPREVRAHRRLSARQSRHQIHDADRRHRSVACSLASNRSLRPLPDRCANYMGERINNTERDQASS